jgi:hypothetical protein
MIGKSLKTNDFFVGNDQVVCLVSCARNRLVVGSQVCYHALARPLAVFPPCCSSTSDHWYLAPLSNPGGALGSELSVSCLLVVSAAGHHSPSSCPAAVAESSVVPLSAPQALAPRGHVPRTAAAAPDALLLGLQSHLSCARAGPGQPA